MLQMGQGTQSGLGIGGLGVLTFGGTQLAFLNDVLDLDLDIHSNGNTRNDILAGEISYMDEDVVQAGIDVHHSSALRIRYHFRGTGDLT